MARETALESPFVFMQEALFERCGAFCPDSRLFVKTFMTEGPGDSLDEPGEDSFMDSVMYLLAKTENCQGPTFEPEALAWMGRIYRIWHEQTDLSCEEIYLIADADFMNRAFASLAAHPPLEAIREIYRQKKCRCPIFKAETD